MAVASHHQFLTNAAFSVCIADELKGQSSLLPTEERFKDSEPFSIVFIRRERFNKFQAKELLPGNKTRVLGDYVSLGEIGACGMGQVLEAEHRHLKRLAAMELPHTSMSKDKTKRPSNPLGTKNERSPCHLNVAPINDAGVQRFTSVRSWLLVRVDN